MKDLKLIYLATAPEHIAYVKFVFESYEEVGIIRTVDRRQAVIVLLAMVDFADTARAILESLKKDIPLQEIPPPADMADDWFMRELRDEIPDDTQSRNEVKVNHDRTSSRSKVQSSRFRP